MKQLVLKMDKWGRIYVPVAVRRRLRARLFDAEIVDEKLVLTPIRSGEERPLTYYFGKATRDKSSSRSSW